MKTTMDYMVGNTAIQIVHTGKRIKIVDVEKQKIRKKFWKCFFIVSLITAALVVICFHVVRLENQKALLDRQVYRLQAQVATLEKENVILKRQAEKIAVDYNEIFKRAKNLGMRFPTKQQIETYTAEKSTAVRMRSGT